MRYDCSLGCSAIFMLVTKVTADKVVAALEPFKGKGTVIETSLAKDQEE
jgi:uncharacterized membrane protein